MKFVFLSTIALHACASAIHMAKENLNDEVPIDTLLHHKKVVPCAARPTPEICNATSPPNHTVATVISAWREDMSWLNHLPLDGPELTVMLRDRSQHLGPDGPYSFRLGSIEIENLKLDNAEVVGEESEAAVKALNPLRSSAITFADVPNVGGIAAGYLQWIIENYKDLPAVTFFLQAPRCSEKANFDMVRALPNIQTCFTPDRGYLDVSNYAEQKTKCVWTQDIINHREEDIHIKDFRETWIQLFYERIGAMPSKLCYNLNSQFAVSKKAIKQHPVTYYEYLLEKVKSGYSDMEPFWRLLFVKNAASWEKPPKRDAKGNVVQPPRVLPPDELEELSRKVNMKEQHLETRRLTHFH